MKRLIALLLAILLCLGLEACSKNTKPESSNTVAQEGSIVVQEESTVVQEESTDTQEGSTDVQEEFTDAQEESKDAQEELTDAMEEPGPLNLELIGPWHLDQSKNDLRSFADSLELFPGYGEWGAGMKIRGNGEMSWYIGAEGWHGTYSVENHTLHAQLTSDLEQSSQNWDFRITAENGITGLEMDYQDMTIYWVYGDREETANRNTVPSNREQATEDEPWKTALADDLFEKYGVLPEYYEDLGDGIYRVYVEVGGEIVPFVTVDSATGDYHG